MVMRRALILGLVLLGAFATHASESERMLMFVADGKQAGEQVVTRLPDGLVKVRYIFKDNGRGPEVEEEFRVAADGMLAEYRATGTSTFGSPIDERFVRRGTTASWESTIEKDSRKVEGPVMYVPFNGSMEVTSLMTSAVASRPDGKLELLPGGVLAQTTLETAEIRRGEEKRTVQLIAQTGLGPVPSFYWTTTGPKPRVVAAIYPGYLGSIEEGWEGSLKELEARQLVAEQRMLKEMAARLRRPLAGLTVVRNARVFDSEKASVGAPSDVYILRGRITAVLPAGAPSGGVKNEIDAAGRVLLPGLFDMHGHVSRWAGGLDLAAGVTTTRDMANDNATLQKMVDETAEGTLLSPQIVATGFIEGESEHSARHGFVVKDLEGAKKAIDWYSAHGYPQLKIYNSFPKEILRDTIAYAHERGMRVSGHIPVHLRAQDAIDAGYDELQHINQVMLNFLVTPETDTRTLERFYLPAEKSGSLDFDSKPVRDFVATLKEKQIVVDPTLTTFDFLRQRDGEIPPPFAAVFEHLPTSVQRSLRSGGMKIPDTATAERYAKSYDAMIAFVGRLHRAGVPIVAGTDHIPGFTLHSELELYVRAGMTPAEALQIATRNGALYSRTPDRGSIAPGKLADLVLVDGDPTKTIGDIRKVALVITQGAVIHPGEVYESLGIKPFVKDAPVVKHAGIEN